MSNVCAATPTPCDPDSVPGLLGQLIDIQRETTVTTVSIKEKLFGEEKCIEGCCPIDQGGYIGDLKRLIRENVAVMNMLHDIAGAL